MAPGSPGRPFVTATLVLMALLIPVFGWLSVTVDEETVTARFGMGLIRKKIPLRDIKSAERVRNQWWYGWGIRMGPSGWIYSVSGLDAVEIELRDGSCFRIGTDDPEELLSAIRSAMFGFQN
jgi:hypothetical protein